MDAMKAAIEDDKLIGIYVGLARDLEEQMKLASPQAKTALVAGLRGVPRSGSAAGATEFSVLNWVAETFSSMGTSFYDDRTEADSRGEEVLRRGRRDVPDDPGEESSSTTRVRRPRCSCEYALTQRRLTELPGGQESLPGYPAENAMMVNVQIEAARMYQEWAAFPARRRLYDRAIRGAEPNPKTQSNAFGAGRTWPTCRPDTPSSATRSTKPATTWPRAGTTGARPRRRRPEQDTLFEKAKQDILRTQELYGIGPEWEAWKPRTTP